MKKISPKKDWKQIEVIKAPKTKKEQLISGLMLVFILLTGILMYLWITTFDWSEIEVIDFNKFYRATLPKVDIVYSSSNTRPIAVMINNHSQARANHAGLQDAYMIYEIIVEGGLTRYMALFKDTDTSRIGSVRSARHYFLDYAMENDAIYVHFGWSPQAESDISKYSINNINGLYDAGFWRDYSLNVSTEHTAFTSISKIKEIASNKGYRMTTDKSVVLNYSAINNKIKNKEDSKVANSIKIGYSYYVETEYKYDSETNTYLRYVNDVIHKDAVTGKQYTAQNILIYQVNNYTIDVTKGRQTIDNIGTGNGWYITSGYAIPITWEKDSREDKTIYKYLDGTEIKFNDGNTWVQIQPLNQLLEISE